MDHACAEVIELREDGWVIVRAAALPMCGGCHAKGSCGDSLFGASGTRTVAARNEAGARVGDLVSLEVAPRAVAASAGVLYGIPAAAVLAGAALGALAGPALLGLGRDASAGLFLSAFLLAALVAVRVLGRRLARRPSFQVRVTGVLPAGTALAEAKETDRA